MHKDDHKHHHDHDHAHTEHQHKVSVTEDSRKRVAWVLVITGGYMLVQIAGALYSGSLALLADAGHMLSDTVALLLSLIAFYIANKPADSARSFGYGRFQILAAFVNGLSLFLIAIWISINAYQRLSHPSEILAGPMLIVAIVGLFVNVIGFFILQRGNQDNMNLRGALLHVLGDLLGSVAAIVAAIIIMLTGWMAIDPILAVVVALLILRSAWQLVKTSAHILLEGTPQGVELEVIRSAVMTLDDVIDVHDLHVWAITTEEQMASLHVQITQGADNDKVLNAVQSVFKTQFAINHCTVQIEQARCIPPKH